MRYPNRLPSIALAAVVAACGLTACGGDDGGDPRRSGSDEDQIRAVAKDFFAKYDDRDWKGVCDNISPKAKPKLAQVATLVGAKSSDCADVLEAADKAQPSNSKLTLKTVRVTGTTAVAPGGSLEDGKPDDLQFEKIDGRWYAALDQD